MQDIPRDIEYEEVEDDPEVRISRNNPFKSCLCIKQHFIESFLDKNKIHPMEYDDNDEAGGNIIGAMLSKERRSHELYGSQATADEDDDMKKLMDEMISPTVVAESDEEMDVDQE